jgi:hypothetical protein
MLREDMFDIDTPTLETFVSERVFVFKLKAKTTKTP